MKKLYLNNWNVNATKILDEIDRQVKELGGEPAVVVKSNSLLTHEDISPVLLSVAIRRELTSEGYKVDFNTNRKKKNDLQVLIIWGYKSSEGEDE